MCNTCSITIPPPMFSVFQFQSTFLCAWNMYHLLLILFPLSISSISVYPLVYVHGTCIYQPSSFVSSFNSIPFLPLRSVHLWNVHLSALLILFCLSNPFHFFHLSVHLFMCIGHVSINYCPLLFVPLLCISTLPFTCVECVSLLIYSVFPVTITLNSSLIRLCGKASLLLVSTSTVAF